MKIYKKKQLGYKDGYIVKDDKVVGVDNDIVAMLNKVEYDYQQAVWNKEHPVKPAAPQEEFAFMTERGKVYPHVDVCTPYLDEATEKAIGIMDDLDALAFADRVNKYAHDIHPLIEWVASKRVVSCDQPVQERFDLKNLGNPLDLHKDELLEVIGFICE